MQTLSLAILNKISGGQSSYPTNMSSLGANIPANHTNMSPYLRGAASGALLGGMAGAARGLAGAMTGATYGAFTGATATAMSRKQ